MVNTLNLKATYNNFLVLISFTLSVHFFFLFLTLSNAGIDLTDEGYHINWIVNPYIYKTSASQFGFFYNPLFIAAGENIGHFRKLNIAFQFLLSYFLTYLIFSPLVRSIKINFLFFQLLIIGSSCFIFLSLNTFTPDYNSLTIKGLLVASIGILFLDRKKNIL